MPRCARSRKRSTSTSSRWRTRRSCAWASRPTSRSTSWRRTCAGTRSSKTCACTWKMAATMTWRATWSASPPPASTRCWSCSSSTTCCRPSKRRSPRFPEETIAAKLAEFSARLELALVRGSTLRAILLARLHRLSPAVEPAVSDRVASVLADFNAALDAVVARFPNATVLDIDSAIASVGTDNAFDWRFYFRGKAPYTVALCNEIARNAVAATRAFGGYFRKVLVVDCDNTLWGGVIGEDLLDGIALDPYDFPGNVYWRIPACDCGTRAARRPRLPVQQEQRGGRGGSVRTASAHGPGRPCDRGQDDQLGRQGHQPAAALSRARYRSRQLRASRRFGDSNANSYASNCRWCARCRYPHRCRTTRAPSPQSSGCSWPAALPRRARPRPGNTGYAPRRWPRRVRYTSQQDYLRSLELRVTVSRNALDRIPRIAELTHKSNQFNVTTRRYTEAQIRQWMQDADAAVYSFAVSDKFGDAGLTGVVIVGYAGRGRRRGHLPDELPGHRPRAWRRRYGRA